MPSNAFAAGTSINTMTVFSARVVGANSSEKSAPINLNRAFQPRGFFSLQVTLSGSGTAKITYELSNDGVTYSAETDKDGTAVDDIFTAMTVGSGFYSFAPAVAQYMKIVVEETGDANPVTITATMGVQ